MYAGFSASLAAETKTETDKTEGRSVHVRMQKGRVETGPIDTDNPNRWYAKRYDTSGTIRGMYCTPY